MILDSVVLEVREQVGVVEFFKVRALGPLGAQAGDAAREDVGGAARAGRVQTARHLFEGGREEGQARNGDAQQRFQHGHHADPGDVVREIIHVQSSSQDKTNDCDGANAVSIGISSTEQKGTYRDTYRTPRAKVIVSSTFLRVAMWSDQIIGIGRAMMVKSMATLQALAAIRFPTSFPQCPGK